MEWTKKLGFPVKDLSNGGGRAEVLLYPGCAYAFDPRSMDALRMTARLLQAASVDFGILGKSEKCCGFTAFNLGYTSILETYAAENIKTFNRTGVSTIVTPCPGCRTAIGKIYSHLGTLNYRVLHTMELLAELVAQGRLEPQHPVGKIVTYHDPCQLGRHARIYDEPRRILEAIPGLCLREMNRTREYAFCCGGDSGVRAGKPDFAQATARRRLAEARETGAELLATACPFCEQNLRDCIDQSTAGLVLVDVAELLAQSVFGETPVFVKENRDALRN
jgi:heterodisulfide reductase subunit D